MRKEYNALVEAFIDPEIRDRAEEILTQLGMTASTAITYFYLQVILQKGLPFELKLPAVRQTADLP